MNIEIRKAFKSDLTHIENIEKTLEHNILSPSILSSTIDHNSYYYFLIIVDDIIAGYIAAELLVDHFDLLAIAVLKEYRKCGLATKLLNKLLEACKLLNVNMIFLEVRCSNIAAIKFYEKTGFNKINIRKNYYTDSKEDAYIYLKEVEI